MYKGSVPGQRGSGQKQVIVVMKESFLSIIDGNLERMGFSDRAAFIRKAVAEKLGVTDKSLITPPSRAGKGGRPRKVVEMPRPEEASKVADDCAPSDAAILPRTKTTYPKGKARKKTK